MTDHDQPQRGDTSSSDHSADHGATEESVAAPIARMLANPRRVRRT